MQNRTITALADRLRACIPLSKSRLETLCLLIVGAIGARTVNLGHIATERGGPVQPASTYRRLQRFFQHVGWARTGPRRCSRPRSAPSAGRWCSTAPTGRSGGAR